MLKRTSKQLSMFSSLEDMLSHEHPLFQLSNKINWECFENAFSPLYCSTNGRPAHPIRLMCGLLILKHLRNVSDEMVVSQWSENAYYQYFCGGLEFMPKQPCDASELVHFRNRIGEKGMELILAESIRVNTGSVLKPSCKSILLSTQFHEYLLPLHHEESPIITLHLSRCTCRLL